MIQAVGLTKTFNENTRRQVTAVKEASFEVAPGEIFGLLGPNGAGKTTLLRMLGTIITPTSGYCTVAGTRADIDPQSVRKNIGFLSGNTRLYKKLTAKEMLKYFGRLYEMDDRKIDTRIDELSELLDMNHFLNRRCASLSTGESQKVSICRVILHDPRVLILDEPTLGLDIMTSRTIMEFIDRARQNGRSIIFSTHYMTEAEILCDRVCLIYSGRLLDTGTKQQLYQKTGKDNLQDTFLKMVDDQRQDDEP